MDKAKIKQALKDGKGIHCRTNEEGREIVDFTTFARSRLAKALGVENGQEFLFSKRRKERYILRTASSAIGHGACACVYEVKTNNVVDGGVLCEMIANPEEITPCPVWGEATIKAARAAELLGFKWVYGINQNFWLATEEPYRRGLEVYSDGEICKLTDIYIFLGIRPGKAIKLSEIK